MMPFPTERFRNPSLTYAVFGARWRSLLNRESTRLIFWAMFYGVLSWLIFRAPEAYAYTYGGIEDENPTFKTYFFKLLRSPFGTLVMVFCALGGFATLYMTREGPAGKQVPVAGIVLLLTAIGLFIMRVMITSGLMGQQYLDYGR